LRRIIIKWDRETLEHIARHGIRREEVEDVFRGRVYVRKRGDEYHIIGRSQDKIIFLIINPKEEKLVTARRATKEEKRLYIKRGK
jgi:uncharacterized DUF497 family protein